MAQIVFFPQTRRSPLIARAAARFASLKSPDDRLDYLILLLDRLRSQAIEARIDERSIDEQLDRLAHAIKAAAAAALSRPEPEEVA